MEARPRRFTIFELYKALKQLETALVLCSETKYRRYRFVFAVILCSVSNGKNYSHILHRKNCMIETDRN